jgi:hypothetical protein
MSEKPRPCPNPWCAKEGIAIEVYGGAFRVVCCCGLEGPLTLTSEEATSAWNSRPVEDALAEAPKDSLVWCVLATSSSNPKQAENAMKQLRINIDTLIKVGIDPEIRMEGLEEIQNEIDAALQKEGRA